MAGLAGAAAGVLGLNAPNEALPFKELPFVVVAANVLAPKEKPPLLAEDWAGAPKPPKDAKGDAFGCTFRSAFGGSRVPDPQRTGSASAGGGTGAGEADAPPRLREGSPRILQDAVSQGLRVDAELDALSACELCSRRRRERAICRLCLV